MIKSKTLTILFLIITVFFLSACDKSDYQKALKAEESKDYTTAIELYSKLSVKGYKDSAKRLKTVRQQQTSALMEKEQWDVVECELAWDQDTCYYKKALYLQQNGRNEEAISSLEKIRSTSPYQENIDQLISENKIPLCKSLESEDEMYQCLTEVPGLFFRYIDSNELGGIRDKNLYYSDRKIGELLFWREKLGETGPFEKLDFSGYMDRCLKNFSSVSKCAYPGLLLDIVYFSDGDPAEAWLAAEKWAAEHPETEALERLESAVKDCINSPVKSEYTGIAYPIETKTECKGAFRPDLETWLRENRPSYLTAEGFWSSDLFYKTFGFDTASPDFHYSESIKADFKAADPYPKSVAVIVSSNAQFSRPDVPWLDDPETTAGITDWITGTAERYKDQLPGWTFIDDPTRASYILYIGMSWNDTGTFRGTVKNEDISVRVYNLQVRCECWNNQPDSSAESKSFSVMSGLGQENSVMGSGLGQDVVTQKIIIEKEEPLTFRHADYDPESGIVWAKGHPFAYSNELVKWLQEQEQTDSPVMN